MEVPGGRGAVLVAGGAGAVDVAGGMGTVLGGPGGGIGTVEDWASTLQPAHGRAGPPNRATDNHTPTRVTPTQSHGASRLQRRKTGAWLSRCLLTAGTAPPR